MGSIVKLTDFFGEISLPVGSQFNDVQLYIDRFEKEALLSLLGYSLYKEVIAEEKSDWVKKLIDGCEFTVKYFSSDVLLKWDGLNNLLKYYVYCQFMLKKVSFTSSGGEVSNKNENSNSASITAKVGSAWANYNYLYGNSKDNVLIPSAYRFLKTNAIDFPNWIFTELNGSINGFDL